MDAGGTAKVTARNGKAGALARAPDVAATLTITVVGLTALVLAWFLPWWAMEARAPQYGQRALVVQVNPQRVAGDVHEIDSLGHYVGIRPMHTVANLERKLGPVGLSLAFLGFLVAPVLRRRRWRAVAVLPAVLMPIVFFADLKYWVAKSATERDPDAALSLTVKNIETNIFGKYEVGQFKVSNSIQGGVYVASLAGLLAIGLVFAVPIPFFRRKKGAALLFGAATLAAPAAAWPQPGGASIQERIDRAREGDAVRVPPGVHRERLTVGKRIRLLGEPGAVLDGGGAGTILRITASGTEVERLTLRNGGDSYTEEDAGIRIDGAADVRVSETEILDTLFGIFVVMGDRCTIERNLVRGKNVPPERRGDGVRLWYSHGCRIRSNRVERSRDVIVWYSNDTRIEENQVEGSRYGLHYMYSDRNLFRANRFEGNQVGASVMYSRDVRLTGNDFSFSDGVSAYGLLLKDSDDIYIGENRFVGNATALFFDNSPQSRGSRVEVRGNLVARNGVGVMVEPNTHDIEFTGNAFIGNRVQVGVTGTGTADKNRWSVGGRGNYWSDAVPYDRDGDGISELPYRLETTFEILADRYPALAFFGDTPAAQAIDTAARLFPIFAPRPKMTDPHPLVKPETARGLARRDVSRGFPSFALAGAGLLAAAGLGIMLGRRVLA